MNEIEKIRPRNELVEMKQNIKTYFDLCDKEDKTYTFTGLLMSLGFDREKMDEYINNRPMFAHVLKKARQKVEQNLEQRLVDGKPPIGLIFNLKNNFGWRDERKIDITSDGKPLGIVMLPQRGNAPQKRKLKHIEPITKQLPVSEAQIVES